MCARVCVCVCVFVWNMSLESWQRQELKQIYDVIFAASCPTRFDKYIPACKNDCD